jgi:hypothetical protein
LRWLKRALSRVSIASTDASVIREGMMSCGLLTQPTSRANPAKVEDFGDMDLLQHTDSARILIGEAIPLRRDARQPGQGGKTNPHGFLHENLV